MKDLRKVKEEEAPQAGVKVFTDHIPTATERVGIILKRFLVTYYLRLALVAVLYLMVSYPGPIGKFMGDWWHNFTTAFTKESVR